VSRLPAILIACALATVLVAGCGEGGVEEGAQLTVYVSAPLRGAEAVAGRRLCAEAREEERQAGAVGSHDLRVVCLDASGAAGRWTLARVGSNARRATEDSTTVAYIGEPDPAARRQSRPIVEKAGIAELGGLPGREAVAEVAAAVEGESADPRGAVFDAAEG